MELAIILRRLWRHRVLAALGVLVAVAAAVLATFDVSSSGLKTKKSETQFGAEFRTGVTVDCVSRLDDGRFVTRTDAGDSYYSRAVIVTFIGLPAVVLVGALIVR